MSFGENQQDATYAFTTFSPFKDFRARFVELLILAAAHAEDIQTDVRARKFLHYAYFARVTPGDLRRAGIPRKGVLRFGALLFNSAYNGDAEVYFRGFSENLTGHMNDLWKRCVGWVDAYPYPNLERFIHRYSRQVSSHVNSYPSFATDVRSALEVRTAVDELMAHASAGNDAAFEAAFEITCQRLWGNA